MTRRGTAADARRKGKIGRTIAPGMMPEGSR